jgi:hypothetical protein
MKKRQIVILTTILAILAAGVLAGTRQLAPVQPAVDRLAAPAITEAKVGKPEKGSSEVPTHVTYGLFFGEMLALKKKADEMERSGRPAAALRDYDKRRAGLSDEQSLSLDQIAHDCNDKVIRINEEAKRIIDRERARHPHGKLNDGEQVPLPPKSLGVLEEQREKTILEAREQLRTVFGEKEFQRFDDFIHKDIAARTKSGPARKG